VRLAKGTPVRIVEKDADKPEKAAAGAASAAAEKANTASD